MKHLVYAAVAVAAVAFSAGAFACEGAHSASNYSKIVVAQDSTQSATTSQSGTAGQSK